MNKLFSLVILLVLIVPTVSAGQIYGPDLIKFKLEKSDPIQTMIWLSGFTYSATGLLRKFGCINEEQYISQRELIIALNDKFLVATISAEEADAALQDYLIHRYKCESI